ELLPARAAPERPVVFSRELHREVVLMLPVVDDFAAALLAGREQIWIAAPANGPRLDADHPAQADVPAPDVPASHPHRPVDAAALVVAATSRLVQELQIGVLVEHQRPRP